MRCYGVLHLWCGAPLTRMCAENIRILLVDERTEMLGADLKAMMLR